MLEKVKKSATKIIPGIRLISYQDGLAKLTLISLQRIRLRGAIIEVCKILSGVYKVDAVIMMIVL